MYRIELEHGTTSGRRMIWVNGRVSGECTLQAGRLTPNPSTYPCALSLLEWINMKKCRVAQSELGAASSERSVQQKPFKQVLNYPTTICNWCMEVSLIRND